MIISFFDDHFCKMKLKFKRDDSRENVTINTKKKVLRRKFSEKVLAENKFNFNVNEHLILNSIESPKACLIEFTCLN